MCETRNELKFIFCDVIYKLQLSLTTHVKKKKFQSFYASSEIFGTWSYMSAQAQTHCAILHQRCVEGHTSKSASE